MTEELVPVFENQWRRSLKEIPATWVPTKSVTIVIPAWNPDYKLDLTLASLAAQNYPDELLEVIVVSDGNLTLPTLPKLKPTRTKVISVSNGSWGRANALNTGFQIATGEVFFCLDCDIIVAQGHIRDNMWVFEQIPNAATKGDILFVDNWEQDPEQVFDLVSQDRSQKLVSESNGLAQWIEDRYEKSDDLNRFSESIFGSYTGGICALSRETFQRIGGLDPTLKLGEDIEYGYRAAQAGAVFVPVRTNPVYHLGAATSQKRSLEVNSYNSTYFAQRIPQLSHRVRTGGHTKWRVPLVKITVLASPETALHASKTISAILKSKGRDCVVELVGPWHLVNDERRRPLEDLVDFFALHEFAVNEPLVELVEEAECSAYPSPFRIRIPEAAWISPTTVPLLLKKMRVSSLGALEIPLPETDAEGVLVLRTAAVERVTHLGLKAEKERLTRADIAKIWSTWVGHYSEFNISTSPFDENPSKKRKKTVVRQQVVSCTRRRVKSSDLLPRGNKENFKLLLRVLRNQLRLLARTLLGK